MCLKGQIIYCLACVLSFYSKEMAETQLGHETAGKHPFAQLPLEGHSSPGPTLSPPTKSSILPSTGHTLAVQKPQESHTCPITMVNCRQLLLTPVAAGKAHHTPTEGRGVTNNSSGKGTPDGLPVCSTGWIHYTALAKAVGEGQIIPVRLVSVQPIYRNIWL